MNDNVKIEPIEMDNGIGFRGSVSLSNEELKKRVDFLEEHSKEFSELVIKAENELYIKELLKRNDKLQSNWNSLREWLEKQKHDSEICKEWNRKNNFNDIDYDRDVKRFDFILDKMNELEGKDKE